MRWALVSLATMSLLADSGIDPSVLTPWTAAGLLGGVLSWYLFVRTPAVDKMMKAKDNQVQELTEVYLKALASKDEAHAKALKDKDAQLDITLTHKWEALKAMSTDYSNSVHGVSQTFAQVVKEQADHGDKTEQRLIDFFEKRLSPLLPPDKGDRRT